MSDLISSTSPFSAEDRQTLQVLCGRVIPPSDKYRLPGADDEAIFANVMGLVLGSSRSARHLKGLLDRFCKLSLDRHGATVLALGKQEQVALLKDSGSIEFLQTMIHYTANAYYQDGRVLQSINLKAEPPFPGGHEVDQGDWSLLDQVRQRKPFYTRV
jgi:hypothetical protein